MGIIQDLYLIPYPGNNSVFIAINGIIQMTSVLIIQ